MSILKRKVKQETRVLKIPKSFREKTQKGCLKKIELSDCDRSKDITDASQVCIPSDSQSRREKLLQTSEGSLKDSRVTYNYVPVVSSKGKALMPCHPSRARQLVKSNKAIRRFKNSIYYIKLKNRKKGVLQEVTCGVDPGSKREGFTVKSKERYVYVGGNSKGRISIHNLETGKRISQNIKVKEIEEMYRIKWVTQFLPSISAGVSLRGNR